MRLPRLRFSLFTLLALPTMFALGWGTGWWSRDRNYNRDVYAAADVIVSDAGRGVVIGGGMILSHDRKFVDRYNAMSPAAQEEMKRRLEFYDQELESSFAPPRPSMADSLQDLVTGEHAATTAEEEREKRIAERMAEVKAVEAKRKAFFETIQANGRAGGDRGRSQTRGTRSLPPDPVTTSDAEDAEVAELAKKLEAMNPKWELDRLAKEAEVIVIGTLDRTVKQPEADYRDDPALYDSLRSVDSHFKVLGVLRGEQIGETVAVAHLAWPPDTVNLSPMKLFEFHKEIRIPALVGTHIEGEPLTLSAGNLLKDGKQVIDTVVPRYVLFLNRDDQGRLVPVSGQSYAALSAMTLNFHEGY